MRVVEVKAFNFKAALIAGFLSATSACTSINLQPVNAVSCDAASVSSEFCSAVESATEYHTIYKAEANRLDGHNRTVTGIGLASGVAAASAIGFEANGDLLTGTALAVGFSGPLQTNLNLAERARIQAAGANSMACLLEEVRPLTLFNHDDRTDDLEEGVEDIQSDLVDFRDEAARIRGGQAACSSSASQEQVQTRTAEINAALESIASAEAEEGIIARAGVISEEAITASTMLQRLPTDMLRSQAQINATIAVRADGALPNLEQLIQDLSEFRLPEANTGEPEGSPAGASRSEEEKDCPDAPKVLPILATLQTNIRALEALSPSVINQIGTGVSRCPLRAAVAGGS